MNSCPLCGTRKVGRIGRDRYYCSECCHEWTGEREEELKIYQILSDGSVNCLKPVSQSALNGLGSRMTQRLHAV